MKKLGIVGHGKMGRMVESLAPEYGFRVCAIADLQGEPIDDRFSGLDVVIEFTEPEACLSNIREVASRGTNLVVGTTGWYEHLDEAIRLANEHEIGMVCSANFSIGIAIFRQLIRDAATLLKPFPEYHAFAFERHHSAKKDAPSGTLKMLVEEMQEAGYNRPIDVANSRVGHVPGTHEIGFDSQADTITLSHVARSREGFARGALHAARWMVGKRGVYEFSDTLLS